MEAVRINKYLGACGVCSRREADKLIEEGRVTVNGTVADMGMKVSAADEIMVDGRPVPVARRDEDVLLAVCKPAGIVLQL